MDGEWKDHEFVCGRVEKTFENGNKYVGQLFNN